MRFKDISTWAPYLLMGGVVWFATYLLFHGACYKLDTLLRSLYHDEQYQELRNKYPKLIENIGSTAHHVTNSILYLLVITLILGIALGIFATGVWLVADYPLIAITLLCGLAIIGLPILIFWLAWQIKKKKHKRNNPS